MNRRKRALADVRPPYDITAPAPGTRLVFGVVAARLQVSITQMADAAGISRTAIADLLSNKWPVKTAADEIRTAIGTLLEQRGATDAELATLWHAFRTSAAAVKAAGDAAPPPTTPTPPAGAHAPAAPQGDPEELEMLLPKQALTPQARRHFKLFTNPFDSDPATEDQMFLGDDFAYVRETAWQCSQHSSFVAVCGESGAGKTTVLMDLHERMKRDARGVIVIKPSVLGMEENEAEGKKLKIDGILHAIITTLDASKPVPQSMQARTVRAQKLMTSSVQAGAQLLLVVEEAHSMPDATLKHLKRLHELHDGRRPLLGILLLAQPELKSRLANGLLRGNLREVAQRCEVVELLPLDSELKPYLQRRVSAVKRDLSELVDDDAVEQIRTRLTKGKGREAVSMCYPLAVNNLVTRALNHAAQLGEPRVTRDVINEV